MRPPNRDREAAFLRMGRWLRRCARALLRKPPEWPSDPYAYVTAPKKPRLPHLSAAAVADPPER